ncbi:MAG: hypothetical protein IPI04_02810 [Ignavibacteria bacterium]|nr:hypothetical protein [Ignavibacteria bacterium]
MIKINILDQSPVISGHSQTDAVNQTIDLAKFGDENGYHRYWVANIITQNLLLPLLLKF